MFNHNALSVVAKWVNDPISDEEEFTILYEPEKPITKGLIKGLIVENKMAGMFHRNELGEWSVIESYGEFDWMTTEGVTMEVIQRRLQGLRVVWVAVAPPDENTERILKEFGWM